MNKITYCVVIFATLFCLSLGTETLAGQAPTANAGPEDLYVDSNGTVVLQGSGYDPDNSNLTYYWNCSGGSLSNSGIAQPTYTAPNTNTQNSYTCSLTVTDNTSLSASDTTTIHINNSVGGMSVQTNSATNVSYYQATLQGNLNIPYISGTNYVWFQWGTSTSYGNETTHQGQNSSGSFNQNISSLASNTTYHYRAVAQNNNNTLYGQDMTFYTSNSGSSNSSLTITKQVMNISSGSLTWSSSVNANPNDVLAFAVTMQVNGGQDVHNIVVKDILPSNLTYRGNLMINTNLNQSGNIASGINIGNISAGGVAVVSYQVTVADYNSFSYGTNTLTNNATVTSNETGSQTASSSVFVNKSIIQGVFDIPTGLTNNFLADSFFLPLSIILLSPWLYFSGNLNKMVDKLKVRSR